MIEDVKKKVPYWRPFAEARTFVQARELKNEDEWRAYCKSGRKPSDIPADPRSVYAAGFRGLGDWLGTGNVRNRNWRPFAEARAFVHTLELQNLAEWMAYCKSGKKPDDIPSNPSKTYRAEFKDLGDWLGTGFVATRSRTYRPFTEARSFVHTLGLKNSDEWRVYCQSGKKPDDIPGYPQNVYGAEFKDLGDWLGTGFVGTRNRVFLPFTEARAYIYTLGLKTYVEWRGYCKSGEKPENIPTNPNVVYRDEFEGWGDWLGTQHIANQKRQYRPFAEARAFVHTLDLKNRAQWMAYCASGKKPGDIPTNPRSTYKGHFKSLGDWLGTGFVHYRDRRYRPFEEARDFIHALELKSRAQWVAYCISGEKPDDIPADPRRTYGGEFKDLGDWLGTGYVHTHNREYRPYEEARSFVRSLGIKNEAEWYAYTKSNKKPDDIPVSPRSTYGADFKSMGDWLGVINKWNGHALLALLDDLRPRLDHLEERELYTILQQGGAFPALRIAMGGISPMRVLKDLKNNAGRDIERTLRNISDDEIESLADDSVGEIVIEVDNLAEFDAHPGFEREGKGSTDVQAGRAVVNDRGNPDLERGLPTLATRESLRVIDLLAELSCGLDDQAAEYLVTNRVSALWEHYTNEGISVIEALLAGDGGHWFTEIKSRFLGEVESVESLVIPEGWSFTATNGQRALPNAMQRRTAWTIREKHRIGNWSGVGAGKTLSAILTSRVIDARVTLVVTNNATVEGWRDQIQNAYPDSVIYTAIGEGIVLNRDRYNYVVLNYEKFQGNERNHLVHLLLGIGLDFIVFDEVQFVKQRDAHASNRRKALEAVVCGASEINPDLRVLGMSATPVINNLLEAKKLLEIVTGMQFPELETVPTVNNALAMHRALMLHGFRYRPLYEQEMRTEIVTTTRNDLLEPLLESQKSVLRVEQVLLPAKLEAARPFFREGTIVYAHYVDEIVAPIRSYLEDMGLSVGLYTGIDKSGLDDFRAGRIGILVGTSPVGTGLDGLQKVCNRIVMLCLPWTGAEYEQIIGRVRRQGSVFGEVEIIIPQVVLDYEGDTWSWDQGRLACIQFKRTLSDCALDGCIPATIRISQNALLEQSRGALERWILRIGTEGMFSIERQRLTVPLPPDLRHKMRVRHGDFTVINQRWNTSRSATTHERIQQDPSEWYLYHTLYREAREKWPEQPFERIAERIRLRPDWMVGDFGCGECLLRQALPDNHIICIDHVAWDEQVIACDMASTPLEQATLDAAVFSLSLMGTNWVDYLREAFRTLRPYGHLFIAEPRKRWQDRIEELKNAVRAQGFHLLGDVEQRYDFVYLTAIKI